ncbi:MAG: hypothetical protein ACO3RK_08530 [Luteolibacter sp.]
MPTRIVADLAAMNASGTKWLSGLCFIFGFASIGASIAIWFIQGGRAENFELRTHGELFGIFVGLWAPTFFILSNRLDRYAEKQKEKITKQVAY